MKRLVATNSTKLNLTMVYSHHDCFKPNGLWYAIDNEWIEWCQDNEFRIYKHVVEIDIDLNNILVIETVDQLKALSDEFSTEIYPGSNMKGIDWIAVKNKYSGIEVRNYHAIKHKIIWGEGMRFWMDNIWFSAWDISSGCIWDLTKVVSYKHIGKIEELINQNEDETIDN